MQNEKYMYKDLRISIACNYDPFSDYHCDWSRLLKGIESEMLLGFLFGSFSFKHIYIYEKQICVVLGYWSNQVTGV